MTSLKQSAKTKDALRCNERSCQREKRSDVLRFVRHMQNTCIVSKRHIHDTNIWTCVRIYIWTYGRTYVLSYVCVTIEHMYSEAHSCTLCAILKFRSRCATQSKVINVFLDRNLTE